MTRTRNLEFRAANVYKTNPRRTRSQATHSFQSTTSNESTVHPSILIDLEILFFKGQLINLHSARRLLCTTSIPWTRSLLQHAGPYSQIWTRWMSLTLAAVAEGETLILMSSRRQQYVIAFLHAKTVTSTNTRAESSQGETSSKESSCTESTQGLQNPKGTERTKSKGCAEEAGPINTKDSCKASIEETIEA